jgi:rhodanese-related sulfurtransferase
MKSKVINLSVQEFSQLSDRPMLIDVRSQIEYVRGHAPGALNISLPRILLGQFSGFRNWLLPKWFRQLSKQRTIAVICLTAHRSPIAAKSLAEQGFDVVFNLTGGMRQWRELNLDIVQGKYPQ